MSRKSTGVSSSLRSSSVKSSKVGGGVVEPGHAFGGGAPRAGRNNDLEAAEVAARIAVLAAVVEPENAEGENAVDHGGGLGLAHADDRIGSRAFEQAAAHVGGAEAVLEIHGRAQAVDFGADEVARQHALEQALIVAAGGVAGGGSAAVAGGNKFKRPAAWLRPCGASSGAGIARAAAPRRRCAPGCARRSKAGAGSGRATR